MTVNENKKAWQYLLSAPVIVASLGYFVDIYDLLLFGIVRIPSLTDLGLNEAEISIEGASILNWQMTGLLLGGILWGILGDKKGRLSVLFGSIITYSIANFACGFVEDVTIYKILRFVAGIGLAGELGAGITLVSESLPKRLRGIGTSVVAGVGLLGGSSGLLFTVELFSWRYAYFTGGGLGILLLLRVFHIDFKGSRKPLVIAVGIGLRDQKFWTSIPQGRQEEAEKIGKLIAEYIRGKRK